MYKHQAIFQYMAYHILTPEGGTCTLIPWYTLDSYGYKHTDICPFLTNPSLFFPKTPLSSTARNGQKYHSITGKYRKQLNVTFPYGWCEILCPLFFLCVKPTASMSLSVHCPPWFRFSCVAKLQPEILVLSGSTAFLLCFVSINLYSS